MELDETAVARTVLACKVVSRPPKATLRTQPCLLGRKDGKVTIETLAQGRPEYPKQIGRVELLGASGPSPFTRATSGLAVRFPNTKPNEYTYVLKIRPA